MSELANIEKIKFTPVTKSGPQSLNGMQAVAYTRIRYVGNGDYERTERQRRVLTALFNKVQSAGVSKYPSLVTALFPYIDTSMTSLDLISLGTGVLTSGTKNLEQERFPVDGYGEGKTMGGVWYLVADLQATSEHIFKYLYDDIKPSAK